jgi:2-dehydropantoate 2-reductase
MRIAVIGTGAVGGYFGGRLAGSGKDIVFLVRGKTFETLRAGPLRVKSIKGDFEIQVRAVNEPNGIESADVVLVAVKAWQIPEAAEAIQKMQRTDSVVVPLQNGMEAPTRLAAVLGPGRVVGGLCRIVAEATGPGEINHYWAEPSVAFGELQPLANDGVLQELRQAFVAAGVRCVSSDIRRAMWEKFLFIAPWGSLGAVTRLPVGALRTAPGMACPTPAVARRSGCRRSRRRRRSGRGQRKEDARRSRWPSGGNHVIDAARPHGGPAIGVGSADRCGRPFRAQDWCSHAGPRFDLRRVIATGTADPRRGLIQMPSSTSSRHSARVAEMSGVMRTKERTTKMR